MKFFYILPLSLVIEFSCSMVSAQKPRYSVEAGAFFSTGRTNPFWIRSNQFGEVPLKSPGFTLRAQAKKEYHTLANRTFSYGYGVRAVLNAGQTNQVLLAELYGKVRFGPFEFYAGRRREVLGLVDTTLSAGSYIWSGNALPMPKIDLSIPRYTPILKNKLIAIKGNYAHGWFGAADSVRNFYLHQKSFYVRLGKPNWRFKFHGGFNHQVQWGGTVLYPRMDGKVKITHFGSDLESYVYVVTGRSLYGGDSLVVKDGKASAEGGNRVGNHLGTLDIGLEYEGVHNRWFIYRQSLYEDGSLYYLSNIFDGLTGLSFNRKHAKTGILGFVIEYLHTSSQGGGVHSGRASNDQLRGYDNYFNNGRYIDGWVYKGQTIGTPFIMPLRYTTGIPQNLAKNPNFIVNNRVNALTIGIKSRIKRFDSVTRLSVSNNLGNYDVPVHYTQASIQQQISFAINKYTINATLAYDNAGVLDQNVGLGFLVKREF